MAKKKVFSIGRSLSDGLEQTIVAAQNYSSELRIDVIPISKIEFDPENPRALTITALDIIQGLKEDDVLFERKSSDLISLQSLSASITDQGIINPVLVYERNSMYRLIAGERRTLASILANKTDIQAKILDSNPDELKIRILQWIENIERSDLTLIERIDNLDKIVSAFAKQNGLNAFDVRVTDISKLIGCTKSHAISLKAVLNADSQIKKLITENKIRNLEKAAVLTAIKSPVLKQRAIDACIKGETLKNLRLFLEQDGMDNIDGLKEIGHGAVNFGSTKNIKVAQEILTSILKQEKFSDFTVEFELVNQCNPKEFTRIFKKIIRKLEKTHENS